MYPRLKLAKELLTDDGVIFISIDDNEQANLKIVCDEIFGEENHISTLPTIMNLKGNNDEFGFAGTHEYSFVYSKNKNLCNINLFPISNEKELNQWKEDEKGVFKKGANLKSSGKNAPREKRPNLFFPIYINSENKISLKEKEGYQKLLPIADSKEMSWRWSKQKILNNLDDIIVSREKNISLYKKQRPKLGEVPTKKPKTLFYKPEYSSGNGTSLLKNLFNKKLFDNPKPIELIKDFAVLGINPNDIILDFFAGSGTTAHAVMQLNAEDGGNRKFILVQLDEKIDPKKSKTVHDFCIENKFEPVISSITIERVNRAGEKIKEELKSKKDLLTDKNKKNLDIGYKVFSLTDKPFINYDTKQKAFKLTGKRNSHLDTLYNMLVATCQTLDTKIETIRDKAIYKANNEIYVVDKVSHEELKQFKDLKINIDSMADFDLEEYLNLGITKDSNITIVY